MIQRSAWKLPLALLGISVVACIAFVAAFPPVEGLGNKVKLPVFHGASTWVNLAVFSILGLTAILYVFTRGTRLYSWVESLRWVGIGMWIVGSLMGFMAAMQTWDFTGSKTSSRMDIIAADPRLMAQTWIVLAGLAILAVGLLIEDRMWLASLDVFFVLGMWMVLLRAILGPGRALHPDSPVLNSDEIGIKLIFFGMVIGVALGAYALTSIVRATRAASGQSATDAESATQAA